MTTTIDNSLLDINTNGVSPDELLAEAIASDDINKFRDACNQGAAINAYTPDGVKPIHSVLLRDLEDPVEMIRVLVHRGADINATTMDKQGEYTRLTPLHLAVLRSENVMLYLIQKGALLNAQAEPSLTPLHMAIMNDKPYAARILVLAGADVDLKNHDGLSSFDLANEKGMKDLIKIIRKGEDTKDIILDEYPENY
jgi:ankyrin repeat protein